MFVTLHRSLLAAPKELLEYIIPRIWEGNNSNNYIFKVEKQMSTKYMKKISGNKQERRL